MSVIFQLNVVFFAIVIFIYQSPRSALRVVFLLVLASLVLNISPRLLHSNTRTFYELTRQQSFWALRRNFYLYHQNIIQYVGAFAVGLMLGYVIVVDENRRLLPEVAAANKHRNAEHTHSMVVAKEKRHRRVVMFTWCAVATIVLCYVWVNQFFVQNASPSEISVLMFFSFGRLAFSLAFAWICYVSISGKIGKCGELLRTFPKFTCVFPRILVQHSVESIDPARSAVVVLHLPRARSGSVPSNVLDQGHLRDDLPQHGKFRGFDIKNNNNS